LRKCVAPAQDGARGPLFGAAEEVAQVGEQLDPKARLSLSSGRYKRSSRYAGAPWPIASGGVGDGEQRFPDIRVTVLDTSGHLRPRHGHVVVRTRCPRGEWVAQVMSFVCLASSAGWG